jgi:hypothetical protein
VASAASTATYGSSTPNGWPPSPSIGADSAVSAVPSGLVAASRISEKPANQPMSVPLPDAYAPVRLR